MTNRFDLGRPPAWLERLARTCLGASPNDTRLGDLAEQYARDTRPAILAGLAYAASMANVALFARVVDPGMRVAETGAALAALDLRERAMSSLRRLAMPTVLFACGAFLVHSATEVWRGWRDAETQLMAQQRLKADALAQQLETSMRNLQQQVGWVAQPQWANLAIDMRRFDYVRLLRQAPPITELTFVDADGIEQINVSRLSMDKIGAGTSLAGETAFVEARAGRPYLSAVHFRKNSEPYITLAMAHGNRGATIAAVNLKTLLDAVREFKIGREGYAYVVDSAGRLIAHPDVALVLRGTNMRELPQVAAAFTSTDQGTVTAGSNRSGEPVTSAQARVASIGWRVFVEVPTHETQAGLWEALARGGGLMALGLVFVGLSLRTVVRPGTPFKLAGV